MLKSQAALIVIIQQNRWRVIFTQSNRFCEKVYIDQLYHYSNSSGILYSIQSTFEIHH